MGKCSWEVNFLDIKMGLLLKCLKELSTVRGQGSGVNGQGSKHGSQVNQI